jgi:hypothetical protein
MRGTSWICRGAFIYEKSQLIRTSGPWNYSKVVGTTSISSRVAYFTGGPNAKRWIEPSVQYVSRVYLINQNKKDIYSDLNKLLCTTYLKEFETYYLRPQHNTLRPINNAVCTS